MNGSYSVPLVAVSVALAVFASYTALDLASSLTSVRGRSRRAWLAGGALALGAGIWSMHFVGMLAFSMPGMPIAYDAGLLVLSILVAIGASAFALFMMARGSVTPLTMAGSALALGTAIAGMHYIGMWAMRMPAHIAWSPFLVAASLVIAVGSSYAALQVAYRHREPGGWTVRYRVGGAVALGAGIAGMHYTGMAAVRLVPLAQHATLEAGNVLVTASLPAAVTGTTLVLLGLAVAGSTLGREKAARAARMEAALHQRTASILESITDAFFALDTEWRFTYVNAEAERLLGVGREQLLGLNIWDQFAAAVGSRFDQEYRRAVAEQRTVQFEAFYSPLDSWFEVKAYPSADGLSVYFQNINQRKRAEAELTAAEAHYRRLVEASPDAIFALDAEGRFRELNPAAGELLGRAPEELIGQPMAESVASVTAPSGLAPRRQVLPTGTEVLEEELYIVRPSGERRLVHIRASVIREAGAVVGRHGIMRDVTDERARDARVRLLSHALDGLDRAVSITDVESSRPVYRNAAWAELFGCDPEVRYELEVDDLLPDQAAREQRSEIWVALEANGHWRGRVYRRRLDDGRVVPLDVDMGTSVGQDGRRLTLAVLHDATERIDRERRLRRAERLASLGTLVGGVAHELNNPLHAILNFAHLLLEEPRPPEEREDLETIRWEAQRMARIVANLRRLARQTQTTAAARESVDLNDIVRRVLELRRYSLETHGIRVQEELTRPLPPVWGDRGEVEQVVLNLVVNAEQALAEHDVTERVLTLQTQPSQIGASVHVLDNGPGIAHADLERIFDPFFTTKSPGEGVGLGLSLVHGIVEEHGGQIRVESEPGLGVALHVDLPRAPEALGDTDPVGRRGLPNRPAAPRPLRILVVDDELSLRLSLARFLALRGHTVEQAADGHEALRLLDTPGVDYHAIVCDLRMPGLGGEELFRRLRLRHSDLAGRMIILTGDAASGRTDELQRSAGVPVLLKPVDLHDLAELIERREVVEAPDLPAP